MINPEISLSNLYQLLNTKLGKGTWENFEPETLLLGIEYSGNDNPIVFEKVFVVLCMAKDFEAVMSHADFILWACAVANGEAAEFEMVALPTSLELAWFIQEVHALGSAMQKPLEALGALRAVSKYVLTEDGYSEPVGPFKGLVDVSELVPGQELEDSLLKEKAINAYLQSMQDHSHV